MKKIYLLFVMLTLALGVFAQSKGKNAMTLRLVDIKVTDGLRLKVSISDARDSTAAALISREFISDIKKTAIRPNRDAACQEALATLTEPLTDFFLNNIPVYGLLGYEGDEYVITCGESLNIRKGDQFQVSLIKYSGGERQSEVVGAVKVQDLRASTSAVSFTEGKDRIIELIPTLDANSFLQCRLLLLKSR